jgi:hypothetical protein
MNTLALYVISFLLGASAQPQEILGVDILSAQELKSGIDSGKCMWIAKQLSMPVPVTFGVASLETTAFY